MAYLIYGGKYFHDRKLYKELTTLEFKSVFPDENIFKQKLLPYGIIPTAGQFEILMGMVGKGRLKWKTESKNLAYIATVWKNTKYQINQLTKFQELTDEKLFTETNITTQTLFLMTRTNTDPTYNAKDNVVETKNENKKAMIDYWDRLKERTKFQDPEILFLIKIANEIMMPIQESNPTDQTPW